MKLSNMCAPIYENYPGEKTRGGSMGSHPQKTQESSKCFDISYLVENFALINNDAHTSYTESSNNEDRVKVLKQVKYRKMLHFFQYFDHIILIRRSSRLFLVKMSSGIAQNGYIPLRSDRMGLVARSLLYTALSMAPQMGW
jgi:hypothetical protein